MLGLRTGLLLQDGWLIDDYNAPTHEAARAYVYADCARLAESHRVTQWRWSSG